jgi:hypothetical protein
MIPRHTQIALVLVLSGIFSVAFYMLHLKNRAEEHLPRLSSDRPLAAPIAVGAPEPVTLFIAYDGDGVMRRRIINAPLPAEPGLRAREVLRTLLAEYLQKNSSHPMAEGSDIADVFLVNGSIAVVDLNSAFAAGHRAGVWVEALTLNSLVATLAANNNAVSQVKFLVNGKERETLAGHADLIALYDVAQVNQFVRSLQ